jgi:hydroxyethylthiazole kinase
VAVTPVPVDALWHDVQQVRATAPLIHNITNYVVMNTTANALLALGASPVMAHAVDEVEEMVAYAGALVINIGTLSPAWIEAMLAAGRAAHRRGIPIVLDPVGSGATKLRTETALRLLREISPTIVRGNASEIASLATPGERTRGVDSTRAAEDTVDIAAGVASAWHCVVAVSGATDIIVGEGEVVRLATGHPMMPRVTGMGCTATALTGAFAAVHPSPLRAAVHGLAITGIAGEIAARRSPGPGSLQLHFLDALYGLQEADIRTHLRFATS